MDNMTTALPQEWQQHPYAIMDEVEGSHWWCWAAGDPESFLGEIVAKNRKRNPQSAF